jgi:uncharacterized Zn-binding protein involved in type VI secretion
MPAAARIGDPVSCGDTVAQGSPDVFVNGVPWTRADLDLTAGHCWSATKLISGASTVFVNDKNAGFVGSPIFHGGCPDTSSHGGSVAVGSPDVFAES